MAITKTRPDVFEGHLGTPKGVTVYENMIINDKVYKVHRIVVHRFGLSDVDDPDLYAAEPMIKWQNSEMGQWVMKHSVEVPMWHRHIEPSTYSYQYAITAWLKGPDYTYWQLKWASS